MTTIKVDEKSKLIEQPETLTGIFDLYKEAIRTHTEGTNLTADYTLSNLNTKEHDFIVDQAMIAQLFSEYIPHETTAKETYNFIMLNVHNVAILSRARASKVLNAVLEIARNLGTNPEPETTTETKEVKK